jgi:hypothetical protein
MRAVAVATAAEVLVLAVVLVAPGASAAPRRAPSPAAAKVAFGHLLHQLYGEIHGYWTCPQQGAPSDSCLGEVHAGRQWHEVGADGKSNHVEIVFDGLFAQTWTRHWWPYSHHWVAPSPGVASVNSSAYGWGFIASGLVHLKDGAHTKLLGYDGDQAGLLRFYLFNCSRKGKLITCRNRLGDAMRYRPG